LEDSCKHTGGEWRPSILGQASLDCFLDAVPAKGVVVDAQGIVVAVNRAWLDFTQKNGAACVGRDYQDIAARTVESDGLAIAEGLSAILRGEQDCLQHDYPCHTDESSLWLRCVISPLRVDGAVTGAAILHLDITDQKRSESRAQALSRAKSDFLASLSHELRTPLNAIIGFSEILMMEAFGPVGHPRYLDYAADIASASRHLLSLINDVLDLSKVEAGKFALSEEPVCLTEVLGQCLHLLQVKADQSGLSTNLRLRPGLPTLVADARLVRQIVLNLLSNAVKFTESGGEVVLEAALAQDGWLEIAVQDTGIGIAEDQMSRILEPFGQIDSPQAKRHAGESTGLGLPLVLRFVELHQGKVRIDSQPGAGTRVSVLFPPHRLRSATR